VCAFESVPKNMCDAYWDDLQIKPPKMSNPLCVKVAVCDTGNKRVQILQHEVQFNDEKDVPRKTDGGCCSVM
jgi:hypothetical protein